MENVTALLDLLRLTEIAPGYFQGTNYQTPWKRVFGGQVLGQALHAAYQTVDDQRCAHSLHAYFILAGDTSIPIDYKVDTIRDGGSFSTRRVVAEQNGQAIFIMAASFQRMSSGFDHQITMPNVLPPNALLPDYQQIEELRTSDPALYRRLTVIHPNAIEFRPVERVQDSLRHSALPFRHIWMKTREKVELSLPEQHQILAYASDYNLLATAVLPHFHNVAYERLFMASLDHAMWFHRDFRMDEWLLYALDSPSASGSRGFTRGNVFNQEGKLVASVSQEGLIREYRT